MLVYDYVQKSCLSMFMVTHVKSIKEARCK
jgi:hypothetical protein